MAHNTTNPKIQPDSANMTDAETLEQCRTLMLHMDDQMGDALALTRVLTLLNGVECREDLQALNELTVEIIKRLQLVHERIQFVRDVMLTPEQRQFMNETSHMDKAA